MVDLSGIHISILDIIAPLWFLVSWMLYSYVADSSKKSKKNLVNVMHKYRLQWMKQMIKRDERLVDIRVVGNLLHTTTFLASTSIIIIAGLVAILGYGEKALPLLNALPFASQTNIFLWFIKSILMLVIFVYSFFKLTWVTRQFNYAIVLILAAPLHTEEKGDIVAMKRESKYVTRIATVLSNAAKHFNMAVRSYYFGLIALTWYIHPVLLIASSVLTVVVLYRREFLSRTLVLLS